MTQSRSFPFTADEFKHIYSQVPRLTVEVVVMTTQGVILTWREESSWQNSWHIPGGTVYYQETLHDAVHRIAGEELGVEVEIEEQIGYIEYPSEEKERGFGWSVGIAFQCRLADEAELPNLLSDKLNTFFELPSTIIEEQRAIIEKVLLQRK
ncbi:MAG TPA: NUDIX domain-containing protein [Vitreimonas sp.]|nr:NUDIX domain-containing protein [Vitreimonas sp.]